MKEKHYSENAGKHVAVCRGGATHFSSHIHRYSTLCGSSWTLLRAKKDPISCRRCLDIAARIVPEFVEKKGAA